jgi:hypothetical protein
MNSRHSEDEGDCKGLISDLSSCARGGERTLVLRASVLIPVLGCRIAHKLGVPSARVETALLPRTQTIHATSQRLAQRNASCTHCSGAGAPPGSTSAHFRFVSPTSPHGSHAGICSPSRYYGICYTLHFSWSMETGVRTTLPVSRFQLYPNPGEICPAFVRFLARHEVISCRVRYKAG